MREARRPDPIYEIMRVFTLEAGSGRFRFEGKLFKELEWAQ